jgi:CHRD domain
MGWMLTSLSTKTPSPMLVLQMTMTRQRRLHQVYLLPSLILLLLSLPTHARTSVAGQDAVLTGSEQVPPVTTTATAKTSFRFQFGGQDNSSIYWTLTTNNTDGVGLFGSAGAHLHCGNRGATGPVIVNLVNVTSGVGDTAVSSNYTGVITDADIVDETCGATVNDLFNNILLGRVYVNVHSTENPSGEIRSQIVGDPVTLNISMTGDEVVPPTDSNVSATAALIVGQGVVGFTISGTNPDGVEVFATNGARIHCGVDNTTGPTVVQLIEPVTGGSTGFTFSAEGIFVDSSVLSSDCGTGIAGILSAIQQGRAYVQITSSGNPDGEVRGQVIVPENVTLPGTQTSFGNVPAGTTPASTTLAPGTPTVAPTTLVPGTTSEPTTVAPVSSASTPSGAFGVTSNTPGVVFNSSTATLAPTSAANTSNATSANNTTSASNATNATSAPTTATMNPTTANASSPNSILIPLSGDNEVPPVDTDVTGSIELSLDDSNAASPIIKYNLSISNPSETELLGVKGAHLHCGYADENGALLLTFVDPIEGGTTNKTLDFSGTIDSGMLVNASCGSGMDEIYDKIEKGQVYVNVHSTEYPDGVIRGQLESTEVRPTANSTSSPSAKTSGGVKAQGGMYMHVMVSSVAAAVCVLL